MEKQVWDKDLENGALHWTKHCPSHKSAETFHDSNEARYLSIKRTISCEIFARFIFVQCKHNTFSSKRAVACGFPKTTWVGQNCFWAGNRDYYSVAETKYTEGVEGWFDEIGNIDASAVCPLEKSGIYGIIGHFAQVCG